MTALGYFLCSRSSNFRKATRCAGVRVGGIAQGIQPADVAHANRVAVVPTAVGAHLGESPPFLHRAIRGNHEMITTALPAQRAMIAVNVPQAEGTARPVGGAVHDNQRNVSHNTLPAAPPAAPVMISSTMRTT